MSKTKSTWNLCVVRFFLKTPVTTTSPPSTPKYHSYSLKEGMQATTSTANAIHYALE